MPRYACLICGKPSPRSYCPEHLREQNQDIRSSRAWRRLSETVRVKEPHCRDCRARGVTRLATQVHHPRPRDQGGELLPPIDELVPLCTGCHNQRRDGIVTPIPTPKRVNPPLIA